MKRIILITYRNGSTVSINVPENYYSDKYSKKPEAKLHKIFKAEYDKFVTALNKTEGVIQARKYLTFSDATVSGKDVLSVDIKEVEEDKIVSMDDQVFVPGVRDTAYLNLDGSSLDELIKKLNENNTVELFSKLCEKLYSYFNKSNVEFSIKSAPKKPSSTPAKKKKPVEQVATEQVVVPEKPTEPQN